MDGSEVYCDLSFTACLDDGLDDGMIIPIGKVDRRTLCMTGAIQRSMIGMEVLQLFAAYYRWRTQEGGMNVRDKVFEVTYPSGRVVRVVDTGRYLLAMYPHDY